MAIPVSNRSVVFWAGQLKQNWKEGVTNLEHIMQNPMTANDFFEHGYGLQCIYGVVDRNSAALIDVLDRRGYEGIAVLRYLNRLLGLDYEDIAAMAASPTAIAAIAASPSAAVAVAASPTARVIFASCPEVMTAIAASPTAMKLSLASSTNN